MNKKIVVGIIILLLLAVGTGYKLYAGRTHGITATGTVEITHADIMPKVNGYITNLTVKAGDPVTAGQIIAKVDRPDLSAQLLRDEAALVKAKVQLTDLEKGPRRQEIGDADAAVSSAQSVFEKAKADFYRYQSLHDSGCISTQQLDAAKSAYDVAYNSLFAAQAKRSLVNEGNRSDVIEAQRLEVERSKAIVDASKTQLTDTVITSPLNGIILSKNYENGEYIAPGSAIATIGDMSDAWVKVYLSSTQLGLISVGQSVDVKIDSFPDKVFAGIIKEISDKAEYTPRQSITDRERANLVFAVKVKLDNSEGILKPGMPADVVIK
ncbi:MAG: mdtN 2 [Firmicutes bacterium]|nr:mdtN 2 [Bacillota bacterium]